MRESERIRVTRDGENIKWDAELDSYPRRGLKLSFDPTRVIQAPDPSVHAQLAVLRSAPKRTNVFAYRLCIEANQTLASLQVIRVGIASPTLFASDALPQYPCPRVG